MKCIDCIEFDNTYYPNRCNHKSNVVYLGDGMLCKVPADELNPDDKCEKGEKKQ